MVLSRCVWQVAEGSQDSELPCTFPLPACHRLNHCLCTAFSHWIEFLEFEAMARFGQVRYSSSAAYVSGEGREMVWREGAFGVRVSVESLSRDDSRGSGTWSSSEELST